MTLLYKLPSLLLPVRAQFELYYCALTNLFTGKLNPQNQSAKEADNIDQFEAV